METKLPFVKSEIVEITMPSIRGDNALQYYLNTDRNGVSIFFYDNGFFEITTDLITDAEGDNYYVSYVPPNYQDQKYSKYDVDLFMEKVNELMTLLGEGNIPLQQPH